MLDLNIDSLAKLQPFTGRVLDMGMEAALKHSKHAIYSSQGGFVAATLLRDYVGFNLFFFWMAQVTISIFEGPISTVGMKLTLRSIVDKEVLIAIWGENEDKFYDELKFGLESFKTSITKVSDYIIFSYPIRNVLSQGDNEHRNSGRSNYLIHSH